MIMDNEYKPPNNEINVFRIGGDTGIRDTGKREMSGIRGNGWDTGMVAEIKRE